MAFEQALAAVKEKQRYCIEKRWKFIFGGRIVDVKEEADKVVSWLDRFKAVGDIVANVDPMHVGLPWAGIRLLLEVIPTLPNKALKDLTFGLTGCRIGGESDNFAARRIRDYHIYGEQT